MTESKSVLRKDSDALKHEIARAEKQRQGDLQSQLQSPLCPGQRKDIARLQPASSSSEPLVSATRRPPCHREKACSDRIGGVTSPAAMEEPGSSSE